MKKIEEIREELIIEQKRNLEMFHNAYERELNPFYKDIYKKNEADSRMHLDNIDEVTLIEIGSMVNSLISNIKEIYSYEMVEYNQSFDTFMNRFIINKEKYLLNSNSVNRLGINLQDLQCLNGMNPLMPSYGDNLRKKVNLEMGINIPLEGEIERLTNESFNKLMNGIDDKEILNDKIKIFEMRRNAGYNRNGGNYYPLSINEEYQNLLLECNTKTL